MRIRRCRKRKMPLTILSPKIFRLAIVMIVHVTPYLSSSIATPTDRGIKRPNTTDAKMESTPVTRCNLYGRKYVANFLRSCILRLELSGSVNLRDSLKNIACLSCVIFNPNAKWPKAERPGVTTQKGKHERSRRTLFTFAL